MVYHGGYERSVWLGIDPGVSGGLAAVYDDGDVVAVPMPTYPATTTAKPRRPSKRDPATGRLVQGARLPGLPRRAHRVNTPAVRDWILDVCGLHGCGRHNDEYPIGGVMIEYQWTRPTDGKANAAATVGGMMVLQSVLDLMGPAYPYEFVTPNSWMTATPEWATYKQRATKWKPSVAVVQELYPDLDLTPGHRRVPHDGMTDAVLIALHARRVMR